jgi:cbb3-type cytochrome oxidase maturation protein
MEVTIALFVAGVALGLAGACMWAWAVHTGQFRDLEKVKDQLFWPELAPETVAAAGVANDAITTAGATEHGTRVDRPTEDDKR